MTCIRIKVRESGEEIAYFTTEGTEVNIHILDKEYMVEIE